MSASIYVFTAFTLIILGIIYVLYLREKHQKAVIGHQYCIFQTFTGSIVGALCRVHGKIATPPRGLLSDNPQPLEFIVPDKTFSFSYPPHYPAGVQATVRAALYNEGDSNALGQSPEASKLSPALLHNLRNESSTALIMKGMQESLRGEDIMDALKTAGGNKTLLYICLGLLAGLGLLGFLLFQMSGQVGELLSLHGL